MKPKPCTFREDLEVPPDAKGKRFCLCGAREDHVRHQLPDVPAQAAHRERYEHDDDGGDA